MRKTLLAAVSLAALASLLPSGAIFADAGPAEQAIETLEARRLELVNANQDILDAGGADNVDISDKDLETIEANNKEIEKLDRQIQARKLSLQLNAGAGRRTVADPQAATRPAGGGARVLNHRIDPRHGFDGLGAFALAVRAHAQHRESDGVNRLMAAATTYGNEGTGADGGFLVPPEFATQLWQKVEAEENLLNRCATLTPEGNSMTIPKDETTPWGSTGLQAYWDGEANTITQSKGVFETSTLRTNKLTALAPVTDEMLEDARGFESWLRAKVPGIMTHKINTAIVSGTGTGMPLGILNSPSLITVSKETSQPADTIWMANIEKMYSRMYASWRRNAIWLINQDLEPQLNMMAFQAAGASSMLPGTNPVPAYLPPGGLSNSPYGMLKGRPVVTLEACSAIGDLGDILFVDFNQYLAIKKASGLRTDTSIHLFFDQSITAFRFIFRVGGQPAWSSTIARQNGSNTLSWATTLQAR